MQSKRLREVRDLLGLKQQNLAALVEVAQSYYSNIEGEKSKKQPSQRVKGALKKMYGINEEYIETGQGKIFRDDGYSSSDYLLQSIYSLDMDVMYFCRHAGISISEFGRLRKDDINHPHLQDILGVLKSQRKDTLNETPVYKTLPRKENKCYTTFKFPVLKTHDIGYIVDTDDMSPEIVSGDLVLANNNQSMYVYGATYIIVCKEITLIRAIKRHKDANKILLVSKNESYDDIEIEKSIILELYLVKQVIKIQGL